MKKIKLSFCIPTYNRSDYLKDTLESIFSQYDENIFSEIEIIISDNCSTDNTAEIVKKYNKQYPQTIKYNKNETNIGGIKNIIKVTDYAIGEYIWLLADDDCITNFSIKYIFEIINANDFDILFCKMQQFENLPVTIQKYKNNIKKYESFSDFIDSINKINFDYTQVISFFSFYSLNIIKNSYFQEIKNKLGKKYEYSYFPHSYIIFSGNLTKIIVPKNIFILGRIMNESYNGSIKLIKDLRDIFNLIENNYKLKKSKSWKKVKKKCLNSWQVNMYIGIILRKLNLDYKNNKYLIKMYFAYRKIMKLIFN
ncbi:MAG: glycosyltransferase family 2 protein [Candidatus Gracilibacteria bacterium]|nr:glycosyltransferase family 2 protein [Candidatus Gracilibacteria bacterium]